MPMQDNEMMNEAIDCPFDVAEIAEANLTEEAETTSKQEEDVAATIETLSARVRELEQEIEARNSLTDRMTRECEEFEVYFPEVSLRTLPESVWTQVQAGVPLAAAYALYERGLQNQRRAAEEQTARKDALSVGLPAAAQSNYFSPSQVRAMSRQEVRENYDRIFESMRHWQ